MSPNVPAPPTPPPPPRRPPIPAAIQFGEAAIADRERFSAQANAFEAGLPSAHVVRLPNASHYVFKSNEADVIREMNAFLSKLR